MSCFSCCEDDDIHKAPDNGGMYPMKSSAGNSVIKIILVLMHNLVLRIPARENWYADHHVCC